MNEIHHWVGDVDANYDDGLADTADLSFGALVHVPESQSFPYSHVEPAQCQVPSLKSFSWAD